MSPVCGIVFYMVVHMPANVFFYVGAAGKELRVKVNPPQINNMSLVLKKKAKV